MQNTGGSSLGGSSLLLHSSQSSFDVGNETDVISLLKIIHQNPLDADIKNNLRDLIFEYRQNQTAQGATKITEAFKPLGILIQAPSAEVKAAAVATPLHSVSSSLGMARPLPSFGFAAAVKTPAPQAVPVSAPVAPVSTPTVAPTPAAITVPIATAAPIAASTIQERIKEIKKTVNDKVGNPVNLIDAHNEIGREYMNALLDAMKKSNGGSAQDTQDAMSRLEKAFSKVTEVLEKGNVVAVSVNSAPIPEQHKAVVGEAKIPEVRRVQVETAHTTIPVSPLKGVATIAESPVVVQVKTVEPVAAPVNKPVEKQAPQVAVPSYKGDAAMHSVAKEKQLQDLHRANREKESMTFAEQEKARVALLDPLMTPDVTAGLNQLLSEWGLFKSSGIFGTGPSGKDHVLFKKLAPLTMAAVIAGRFDGATTSIKQNITDYMNGWRYEEGIVHEHGETFEHYLRKVIFHILLKKKQLPQ